MEHHTEAVPHGWGQKAGSGGGAYERERSQLELDGTGARALSNDDIQTEVLHGGVQALFHHMAQPMDLIDEQHIVLLEIGQ